MKKGNYHRWRGRKYSFILFVSIVFAFFCLFILERNSPFFSLLHSAPYLRVAPSSDFISAQNETPSHDSDSTIVHSPPDFVDSPPDFVDSPPDFVDSPPDFVDSPPDIVDSPPSVVDSPNIVDADAPAKVCSYAKGRWVADGRRPFYSGSGCKQWLSPMWACRLMQRADYSFENYRWVAENCDTPEFGPSAFLQRMKDKTIAFVGDSLGRQQFQSLMCMITEGNDMWDVQDVGPEYGLVTPPGSRRPNGWAYRFRETNTTVLYYWSSTLCGTDPINSTDPNTDYAMHLDRPPHFLAQNLARFSVVVLNTGHHWNRGKLNENRWKVYVNGQRNQDRRLERVGDAKSLAVHSVVRWADSQLPAHPGLKVFLRTLSPRHFVGGDWDTGGSCDNTTPLQKGSEVRADHSADPLAQDAVNGTRVTLLDITAISQLRDEGHIAASFRKEKNKGGQDCLHWCLPGIPDTWNELLYALL